MFFLLKCIFWLAITLLAVLGRVETPRQERVERQQVATERATAPLRGAPRNHSVGGGGGDILSGLAELTAAKLTGVAREHCLAHPLDCLTAAEQLGKATARAERR